MRGYYDQSVPVGGRVHGRRHRTHRHRAERQAKKMDRLAASYPTVVGRRPIGGVVVGSGLALLAAGAIGFTVLKRRSFRGGLLNSGLAGQVASTNYGVGGIATGGLANGGIATGGYSSGVSGIAPIGTTAPISTGLTTGVPMGGIASSGIAPSGIAPITALPKRRFSPLRFLPFFGRKRMSPLRTALAAPGKIVAPGMTPKKRRFPLLALLPLIALGGLFFGLRNSFRKPKQEVIATGPRPVIVHRPMPVPAHVEAPVVAQPLVKKRRLPLLRVRKVKKVVPVEETIVEPVAQVQPVPRPVAVRHHVKTLYPAVEEFSTDEDVPARLYGRPL